MFSDTFKEYYEKCIGKAFFVFRPSRQDQKGLSNNNKLLITRLLNYYLTHSSYYFNIIFQSCVVLISEPLRTRVGHPNIFNFE